MDARDAFISQNEAIKKNERGGWSTESWRWVDHDGNAKSEREGLVAKADSEACERGAASESRVVFQQFVVGG